MGTEDTDREEQLVAQAGAILLVLSVSNGAAVEAREIPKHLAEVRKDLTGAVSLSSFGESISDMHVRYSLRDGWNMPDLRTLLNLITGMGWARVLPGGHVELSPHGRGRADQLSITPRERLAVTRALGTAPTSVEVSSA